MPNALTYYPFKKGALLIPTLPSGKEHLFFVCHNPVYIEEYRKNSVLAVNLTTIIPGRYYDPACECDVNDHPFIKHPSYILYREAAIFGADTIVAKVNSNEVRIAEICSDELFNRIINGFNISMHVKNHIKEHFSQYCT